MKRKNTRDALSRAFIAASTISLILGFTASAQAQGCIQPPADMVSWWKADGDALDVRGRNNGTLLGNPPFATGVNGSAFHLGGIPHGISLGHSTGTLEMTSMTIEAWIKKDGVPPNGIENILAKWYSDATGDSFLFGVVNDGGQVRLFAAIGDGVTGDNGFAGGTIPLNTWTHVAMTYDCADGRNRLYVNGVEVASRTRPNGIFPSATYTYIGRELNNLDRYFKGYVDEPAVYRRALALDEIQSIYNAGTAGKCEPPNLFSQTQSFTETFHTPLALGQSLALSGNLLAAGLPNQGGISGAQAGRVMVYVRSGGTWTLEQPFLAGLSGGDRFGHAVAISGDTLVVGSPGAHNRGTVSVFVRSGLNWSRQQILEATDWGFTDEFGESVAISGNTIVVGAHNADQPGGQTDAGAVYVFNRTGTVWTRTHKFIPTEPAAGGDKLGESVAISGDTIVAGAPGDDAIGPNTGSVYVYERTGGVWSQQQRLVTQFPYHDGCLGATVAVDGNTIAASQTGNASILIYGSVFIFSRTSGPWGQQGIVYASDPDADADFGVSIAINGSLIAVGAPKVDNSAGFDAGTVYIFPRDSGTASERQKLNPTDGYNEDWFGSSVALDNNDLIVSAPFKDPVPANDDNRGVLYAFRRPPISPFDFDADGMTDISVYRPGTIGTWYVERSTAGFYGLEFGGGADKIVPADYDGDGRTDIAVYRPSEGMWYRFLSASQSFIATPFGLATDIPAPGDFDGDSRADLAIFRPSDGNWWLSRSTADIIATQFGQNGDVPVVGDYDGDGTSDIGIFRPSNGLWFIRRSASGDVGYQFGFGTDKVTPADYDGDGKTDIAVYRPSTGQWFIANSGSSTYPIHQFGGASDIPAPGDYDGDGRADVAIFRPSDGNWWLQRTAAGLTVIPFGQSGDKAVPNAYGN